MDQETTKLIEDSMLLPNYGDCQSQLNNWESLLSNILMENTPFSQDICQNIVDYLPPQYQFIRINMIMYDEKYSIMEFVLFIINNIVHYLIAIIYFLLSTTISVNEIVIFSLFIILCLSQTLIIVKTYRSNNYPSAGNKDKRIKLQIIEFMKNRNVQIFGCIYNPLSLIILSIPSNQSSNQTKYILIWILFIIPLSTQILYSCYMHHRRKYLNTDDES